MYSNSVLVAECLLMSESATILITQALPFSKQPWIAQPGVIKGLLFTLTNCKLIWINLWSVNWAVLQSPEQTQWLRTAALLWPEISWGVTQSRVRGHWLLKCSEQDDRAAPPCLSLVQREMEQLRAHHLPSSPRELISLPTDRWGKQLFQGLSKIRSTEKLGDGCSLFVQVPGLEHQWKHQTWTWGRNGFCWTWNNLEWLHGWQLPAGNR